MDSCLQKEKKSGSKRLKAVFLCFLIFIFFLVMLGSEYKKEKYHENGGPVRGGACMRGAIAVTAAAPTTNERYRCGASYDRMMPGSRDITRTEDRKRSSNNSRHTIIGVQQTPHRHDPNKKNEKTSGNLLSAHYWRFIGLTLSAQKLSSFIIPAYPCRANLMGWMGNGWHGSGIDATGVMGWGQFNGFWFPQPLGRPVTE